MVGWEPFLWNWSANRNIVKGITETVIISEGIARAKAVNRSTATETVTISENTAKSKGLTKQLSESVIVQTNDIVGYTTAGYTAIGYTTQTDAVRTMQKFRPLATETVNIFEAISRVRSGQRAIGLVAGEVVIISSSVARTQGKTRVILPTQGTIGPGYTTIGFTSGYTINPLIHGTQSVTISESLGRVKAATRTISQTVIISETLDVVVTALRNIVKGITESVTISENLARQLDKTRSMEADEEVIIDEGLTRVKDAQRSISDSVSVSDNVSRTKGLSRVLANEIVTISEAGLTIVTGVGRSIIENVIISETLSRVVTKSRSIPTQIVSVSDSVTRAVGRARSIPTEIVSISDTVQRQATTGATHLVRTITENVVITDTVTAAIVTRFKPLILPIVKNVWRNSQNTANKVESINKDETERRLFHYIKQRYRHGWLRGIR